MNESIEANIGNDIETAFMAFRMESTIWIARISRFLIKPRRSKKLLSQPKYFTNRTDCRISCVRETLWSVILLIAFLRTKRDLMPLVSRGRPMTRSAKPAKAEYVRLTSNTTRVIAIETGDTQSIWNIPEAWSMR